MQLGNFKYNNYRRQRTNHKQNCFKDADAYIFLVTPVSLS